MSERLLTTRETATRLGRSRDFVMGLIRSGRVECVKIGDRYYVPEWSLLELTRPKAAEAAATLYPERIIARRRRRA